VIKLHTNETELLAHIVTLEQTLTELDRVIKWLKSEDQKMTDEFTDDEENQHFRSPLVGFSGWNFEQVIEEVKRMSGRFVVTEMSKLYKNITLDPDEICSRFQEAGIFPTAIHTYIQQICADEDKVALEQIKDLCTDLLPWGDYGPGGSHGKANKPEYIMNKNTMVLSETIAYAGLYNGIKRIRALVNFIKITLEDASPADVEPQVEIIEEFGTVMYQDDLIKSIRVYKNGNVKVVFHDPTNTEIMCKALTDLVL
jgi:hypothetical protein